MDICIPNSFLPERKYIIDVLFKQFLSVEYNLKIWDSAHYKITLPNSNQIIIYDDFFSGFKEHESYLNRKSIPARINFSQNRFIPEKDIPVIYGTSEVTVLEDNNIKTIECKIDIFSSCFFMLTRWEEFVIKERDRHNRFPSVFSLANKSNFLHRPVVNEYIEMLLNFFWYLGMPEKKKENKYEIVSTHDIDWVYPMPILSCIASDIVVEKNIQKAFKRINARCRKKNPYDSFDRIMNLCENENIRARFYFMSESRQSMDNSYRLNDTFVKRTFKKIIERGHIIGFHPGYNTYNDKSEWGNQLQILQKHINTRVIEGRQHYLRFCIPDTWQIWDEFGMHTDSSMAYPDQIGFRCGTASEFTVFNVIERKSLNLIERPLIIMDTTLKSVKYENKTAEQSARIIAHYKGICKKYNMPLTLLYHNSSFDEFDWAGWEELFKTAIGR